MYLGLFFKEFCVLSLLLGKVLAIDSSEPLLLTPFIEQGGDAVEEALSLSKVPEIHGVQSYSGFFTVDKKCERNLFFWFFPAESNWKNSPIVLWLNGGPRMTSLCAVFDEIGPWHIRKGKISKREYPWTAKYNVIFLDQQVGTGFSFSKNQCYAKTVKDLAEGIYSVLTQFFTLFPELQKNELVITGFYFVSHFGTAVAVEIDEKTRNDPAAMRINLKGVLIENPRTTAECHDFSDQVYQLGIVDYNGRRRFKELHNTLVRKVKEKKFSEAEVLERKMWNELSLASELPSVYNYAADEEERTSEFINFVEHSEIMKQLHTGDIEFVTINDKIFQFLLPEYFGSPNAYIEHLLKRKIIVGIYNSQLDIHSSYSETLCFLNNLKWTGSHDFSKVKRHSWHLQNEMVGWFKIDGSLFELLVRKVGHYPHMGQRQVGLKLLEAVFDPDSKDLLKVLKS